jgi:hypothetical protein
MQMVLNLIWDRLLPALQARPLPVNAVAASQLGEKLRQLEVPQAQGAPTSPATAKLLNRTYAFPANDQKIERLALVSSDSGKTLGLAARIDGSEINIPCGFREWKKGRAPLFGGPLARFADEPTAGSFAWPAEDTCVIKLCAFETPYHTTLKLKFDGEQVTLDSETNVAFGPTKRPQLVGRPE